MIRRSRFRHSPPALQQATRMTTRILSATTHIGMVNPSAVVVQPAARRACDWSLSRGRSITYRRRQSEIFERMESCLSSFIPQPDGETQGFTLFSSVGKTRNRAGSIYVLTITLGESSPGITCAASFSLATRGFRTGRECFRLRSNLFTSPPNRRNRATHVARMRVRQFPPE